MFAGLGIRMGVVLVDLGDDNHSIVVGNAGFRATLEILWPLPIVDEARRERLRDYWPGVQFTEQEARALGNEIIEHHISDVNWLSDVFPPTGYWKDFLSPKPVYNESTYWPGWLRAFAAFCLTCKGFIVY